MKINKGAAKATAWVTLIMIIIAGVRMIVNEEMDRSEFREQGNAKAQEHFIDHGLIRFSGENMRLFESRVTGDCYVEGHYTFGEVNCEAFKPLLRGQQ